MTALMICIETDAHELIVQKVIMNNGSVHEGYIASQKVGSNEIMFKSFCSTITLSKKNYKNVTISTENIEISDLSEEWKSWAKENKAISVKGQRELFPLSTIITDNDKLRDIYVKDIGDKIKYVTMKEQTLKLSLDSIVEIKGVERPLTLLSGTDRIYELKNGNRNIGQYVGEKPKEYVKLMTEDGHYNINKKDIVKCVVKPVNKEQDIIEQSPLIDIIKLKGGETYEGIITEQNFVSEDEKDWFLTLIRENNNMTMLKYKDIVEFKKEKNYSYRPVHDIIVGEGEFCLNDSSLVFNDLSKHPVSDEYFYELSSDSLNTRSFNAGTDIVLSANLGKDVKSEQFVFVSIKELIEQNNKKVAKKAKKESKPKYKLSLLDIVINKIQPTKKSGPTKNGTTRYTFKVNHGDYVLVDLVNLKYVIIKIQ